MCAPALALVVALSVGAYSAVSAPAKAGAAFPWTLNPTGLLNDSTTYVGLYAVTIPAKELLNIVLKFLGGRVVGYTRMDEGDQKVPKLEVLEFHDLCYLALNTLVEFLGMNHIMSFLLGAAVEYQSRNFNIFNGPLAFIAAFVLNDVIYYPFHLVAHRRIFYPYCHKQHHRQFVPFRGYADAANQHPLEQMYGFCIWIGSLWIISKLMGLHAATAWLGTLAWAILNICNHLPYDTALHLPLPYPALPKDHNTHHRFPNTNFATLSTMTDRMFGTFRPYRPAGMNNGSQAEEEKVATLREAVPSQWSVLSMGVMLFFSLLAVEAVQLGGALPSLRSMLVAGQPSDSAMAKARLKRVLLAYGWPGAQKQPVYQIPPASSSTGHKADDWKKCIWRGKLRIAGKGQDLNIKLLDPSSGNLFAQCAIPNGDYDSYVERVLDSSRYFVLKITNGDRHAFIGLGFEDRNDAFDFNCTLSDFKSTWIDRKEESAADMMPAKDLSLKEGQTIKINLPGKSRRREEKAEAGYGGGIGVLAPPPSGGSRRQGAAPAPAPAVSMAPAAAPAAAPAVAAAPARQAPADDFFGDFNDFQGGGFAAPPLPAPATPPAAAPAPAPVPSPVRAELSLEGFGGPSPSKAQAPLDPFAGNGAQAPWPGDFGGFTAAAPAKNIAPAPAPARQMPAPAPAPSRGKDPFDDLDIFK
ncbi:unnamed protein product [Effrenium voratum]|nr:unnamed protein product [Effrenium voratum]